MKDKIADVYLFHVFKALFDGGGGAAWASTRKNRLSLSASGEEDNDYDDVNRREERYWDMSMFTCITCRVAFTDNDVQREHYKTDWHRYNLKRKVAELPPVTADNFKERVLAQRAQATDENKTIPGYCSICSKHFVSKNSFANHLSSKKHKELETKALELKEKELKRLQEKSQEKGLEYANEDDEVARKNAKNLAIKMDKLQNTLAFNRPSASASGEVFATAKPAKEKNRTSELFGDGAVDDDDEEMESDGEALGMEECLFCQHCSKSINKNVHHMTTAHSFFIPDLDYLVDLEGLLTYLGEKVGLGKMCLWCNDKGKAFLSTKAAQQHMVDKGHCKILHEGEELLEYADYYDYRSSYPDFKDSEKPMETDDDEEDNVAYDPLEDQGYQLVLPSGAVLGHRSLARYYKQNLPPERVVVKTSVQRVIAQYKALGWLGATGKTAEKKRTDMAFVQRWKARKHMQLGVKANKLQHHFREQVIF